MPFTVRLFSRTTPPQDVELLVPAPNCHTSPWKELVSYGWKNQILGKIKWNYILWKKIRAGCRWHIPLLPALEGRGSWSQCEFGQLGLYIERSCLKVKINLRNNTFIYLLLKMCVGNHAPKHTCGQRPFSGVSSLPPTTEVSRIKLRLSAFVEGTWTCHAIPLELSKWSVHGRSFSLNIWTQYSF